MVYHQSKTKKEKDIMRMIFDQEFEINWQLKLRLEIFCLVDKSKTKPCTGNWYGNSCSMKFTVLPLNENTDKRAYADETLFGKKGEGLSITVSLVESILDDSDRFKSILNDLASCLSSLVFAFLNEDQEEENNFLEEFKEAIIICRKAVEKDKKIENYHHFAIGG